ncbi:hepatocyte cell adhesion molecule-like isoform X1 [Mauremys reevesii]|uniref:hepatocyte cell adhesion molecule-like isoform X1 n=1 Tax=Mauremys reevesii TaxID=260615 RepID=UPI00193F8706|nr:hepatocyte cell adhesion molecule-like isoform X1 [Mauremys reevesii]
MKSRRGCWSILLFLSFSYALLIDIPQESVKGTVGHSVLLSISYRLQGPFSSPLSIQWNFSNYPNPLTMYTVTNCSVSAEGIPTRCSGHNFINPAYQGRTVFFPENASLLLQNLQLSDSGVYSVTFKVPQQTRHITLTVSEPHFNHGNAEGGTGNKMNSPLVLLLGLLITGGLSFLLLLLLLFFFCRGHKGAVQQKRTRIIKQQEEVPNHEDSHMESSLPMTVSTIYARIGEDAGQRQCRSVTD